jgi:hypothetical protein
MRVLFLDIDGVLNSADYLRNRRHVRRPTPHSIDAPTVPRLNAVTDRTGAALVISSTWRLSSGAAQLPYVLRDHGVTGRVVGMTPSLMEETGEVQPCGYRSLRRRERGHEIQAWLDAHPECARFAIVDDNSDMAHLRHRLVQTTWERGLQDEHVETLCALLGERTP